MKRLTLFFSILAISVFAQKRANPLIQSAGGILEIPYATVKPDPSITYNIVIELATSLEDPKKINQGLNNVARLINLHAIGGVPKEKLNVVLVVHGEATNTLMDSKNYELKFHTANPNIDLYEELADLGTQIIVCGQSLEARNIDKQTLIPQAKVAVSMLTTVTTYQLKGYAFIKF